jgi:hypothetical protein
MQTSDIVSQIAGAPFKKFASVREKWAFEDRFCSPGLFLTFKTSVSRKYSYLTRSLQRADCLGVFIASLGPIQFAGPNSDDASLTLLLEQGVEISC